MSEKQTVKLTKEVSIKLPGLPNFLIHNVLGMDVSVSVTLFSKEDLKKIGEAWTKALIEKGRK